ncbi:MAG: CPBP family intramembrane metalloprotease [Roseburia sp.]|nr:CPBP family intramembrane metalloprotease [Roseburia sp.]MCM1243579.1 CPBP family intramembrane metalloprotease [Roseburia sp.]
MNTTKKQFTIYMISAFAIAWILQIIAGIFARQGNLMVLRIVLVVTMFVPAAATLIAGIPLKGMGWRPKLKGKIRYIFVALWLNSALMVVGAILFFCVFPKAFDADLAYFTNILISQGGEQVLEQLEAQGLTVQMYLVVSALQALTFAPFLNMFAALGEEVGWRGVMTPYLKEKLGVVRGRLLSGLIWGAWHWPAMILFGYEYGTEYIGAPVLGPIVFCLCTTAMGILLDDIYEKTDCIWFPALMHGSVNAFATIFPYLVKEEYSKYAILGPAYIGLIAMIPLWIAAGIILMKGRKQTV